MPRLALLVLLALLGNTLGFLHKSACLIDPISRGHTGEYEHDDEEERREEMFPSGHQHAAMPGGNGRGGHEEDDEEEENHGRGHPVARPVARVQGRSGYRDEDGEWEDARRRRQALSGHRPDLLVGQIACPGHTIHLINVVIGYSNSHLCIQSNSDTPPPPSPLVLSASPQAYEGCQAGSPKATQVLHCQGETGTCQVAIRRVDMPKCGQTVNFAVINYECVPEAKRVNICAPADRDVTDGVVITSPAYPQLPVSTSAVSGSVTSCECTLRAEADSQIVMEYLRSHLPGSGVTCDGDMLVLERPDPKTAGRYVMEREICGHNVSSDVIIHDSILRVTYLGGAPLVGDKSGFIAKFKALSKTGANTVFHISCQEPPTVGANSGKVSGAQAKAIYQQQAGRGESPPAVAGTDAGDSAGTSPGILSGVVASLASVIVIMGSVGAALLHRRRQKKRRELEELERYGTGSQNWYEYGGSTKSDAPYYG
ncbi:uncharacterized protein LOC131932234 [Physella acuta]|uniref:uncharacterized protein LOC131932234 n=1 Tax=Physella acuta TaxID=109671 RepID=UPI0027DC3D11|nr:uncharacterized protein LOC131932234 [Physella acuta]